MHRKIKYAHVVRTEEGKWYLQIAKCYTCDSKDISWQDNPTLGNWVISPNIDLQESLILCKDEEEAMFKLAEHYAKEYKLAVETLPMQNEVPGPRASFNGTLYVTSNSADFDIAVMLLAKERIGWTKVVDKEKCYQFGRGKVNLTNGWVFVLDMDANHPNPAVATDWREMFRLLDQRALLLC
jgi:nitrogen fixation protein